jgi:ATP-dependent RNA helicase DOB1
MSDNAAGPSKSAHKARKQKRKNDGETSTPAKTPRVISPERDEDDAPIASSSKNGADPMEALETEVDPMEKLAGESRENEGTVVPTRADEFEQEAEREVEAAKGLDGAAEEGKMKLVHQVRHQVRWIHNRPGPC